MVVGFGAVPSEVDDGVQIMQEVMQGVGVELVEVVEVQGLLALKNLLPKINEILVAKKYKFN